MNQVLHWIVTIVLFIISLSLLIVIHELGHLSMAKLFNVYCKEFSVGFGPALLHKRKEGKETYFSIRAVPLGGYVSMYGEDVELEEGVVLPPERSLDGIKRWKKAIILVAGVTLNAVLALTLFAVSNLCFKNNYVTNEVTVAEGTFAYDIGLRDGDTMYVLGPADGKLNTTNRVTAYYKEGEVTYEDYFFVIDDNVTYNDNPYVLCYYPSSAKVKTSFSSSIFLFQAATDDYVKETSFKSWTEAGIILAHYPEYRQDYLKPIDNTSFVTHLNFVRNGEVTNYAFGVKTVASGNSYVWEDFGLYFKVNKEWAPFSERVKGTFEDFGHASVVVFKGLGMIFTGGIKNMSGIVGILNFSSTVLNNYSFSYYIYLWGLISVNLAIFNLLPFPGLDGWALLVTGIEGSVNSIKRAKYKKQNNETSSFQEWKIPSKVKNIVSFIGLALLMLLMLAIVVLDILRWIGVM